MSKKILDKVALFHGEGFLPTNLKNGGTILKGRDGLSMRLAKSNGEKTPWDIFMSSTRAVRSPTARSTSGRPRIGWATASSS